MISIDLLSDFLNKVLLKDWSTCAWICIARSGLEVFAGARFAAVLCLFPDHSSASLKPPTTSGTACSPRTVSTPSTVYSCETNGIRFVSGFHESKSN